MNTLDELNDAYSFLRDPIIKKAIDRIMVLEAALSEIECDCTTVCWASEGTEKPSNNCTHFIAKTALRGEQER